MRYCFGLFAMLLGSSGFEPAMAQSSGTFTATNDMTTPRQGHTATLLKTGEVLIAGGLRMNQPDWPFALASAELYDPVAGTFTATGNMAMARSGHTATRLPSGKVLIAGGGSGPIASAELYDPATGLFTSVGPMTTPRAGHSASLLNNGKVLIAGGYDGKIWAASADLYDPLTGAFIRTGDMTTGRNRPVAVLLANGKVLIAGEGDNDGTHADLYDSATGAFSPAGEAPQPAYGFASAAALLTNGKVLLTLTYQSGLSDHAELYDPTTETFALTGNMSLFRYFGQTATLLPDGKVLVAGTHDYDRTSATADLYDPATGTFHLTGDRDAGREEHTATLLPDGTILLSGGVHFQSQLVTLSSALIYHPAVSLASPVLFSLTGERQEQGAVWHAATGNLASEIDPAVPGEALAMYTKNLIDGSRIPPQVVTGGRMAEVLYFGNAPGYAEISQVNFRMPAGVSPGPAVPVSLVYLDRPSNEVTIGVQ